MTPARPAGPPGDDATLVPTFGVGCLLVFCLVVMSRKVPLGEAAAVTAFLVAILRPTPFTVPPYYRWYLLYFALGIAGFPLTAFPESTWNSLVNMTKVIVIGLTTINLVTTERDRRTFVLGYLLLFALFPVRGALYNYANGITEAGRISWNFFFTNPNDLAITCFLPLGLCGFVLCTEKGILRRVALAGIPVLLLIQFLTQSRGAIIAVAIGLLYFLYFTRNRLRSLVVLGVIGFVAVVAAPQSVWDRMSGLGKARIDSSRGLVMYEVDEEGSATSRWGLMRIAARIALDNPFLGVGAGSYAYAHEVRTRGRTDLPPGEVGLRDAHNTFLKATAESGFLAGFAISAFMIVAIRYCRRVRRSIPRAGEADRDFMGMAALEASMVAYVIAALFNSAEQSTFTMLQFVVPCAIASVLARRRAAAGTLTPPMTSPAGPAPAPGPGH